MKITIFGLTVSSSWGNGHATPYRALLRALHRMGYRVVFYERDVPYYAKRRDFSSADFCQLVLYSDWQSVRERALGDARDSDVIVYASFCPEGARLIEEIGDVGDAIRVFYDLDTPVTLDKLAHGTCDYLRPNQIPQFDLYLSWCGGEILTELQQHWGARRALPLYGCVDPVVHARVEVPEPYRCALSYMGTYAADRQHKFEALFLNTARNAPDKTFVLAGSMYPHETEWPANVRRFEHVSPHDHPALYSGSRITLNLTRDTMSRGGYCPSGRLFEAAACGTPIVSDWFEGLAHFFNPEEEIVVVRNNQDVLRVLEFSDAELQRIATRARERTLAENTGDVRAGQLVQYLEETISRRSRSAVEVA